MYSGRLWVLVSAVTIDNFPACLGRPGRVWLVIMDGDGEWRQVKVCQRLESRGCVVTSLKLMRRPTLATQQHRHQGDGERDIAPGLHNQVLICSVRRNASFFCTRRLFDLLACVVMLPCVTSALFISPRSPAQTASSHQTASWVSQTQTSWMSSVKRVTLKTNLSQCSGWTRYVKHSLDDTKSVSCPR